MSTRWWRLPPAWARRWLLAPAVVILAVLFAPFVLVLGVAIAPIVAWGLPGRLRHVRLVWLVGVYVVWDGVALVVLAVLGLRHVWTRFRSEASLRDHYLFTGIMLRALFAVVRWTLRLEIVEEDAGPVGEPDGRPVIVLCRHAGPGDSFIVVEALINRDWRRPAIVLKDTMQWDPALGVLFHRVPSRFITPERFRGARAPTGIEAVAALARDLPGDGALLIFPEGGNVTPTRRRTRIAALRAAGRHELARRAEAMPHVLPPHTGGVLAAMEARPDAAVMIVAHAGLDRLMTAGDVWRSGPADRRIVFKRWTVDPSGVPAGRARREAWLYEWWAKVDAWIATHDSRDSGEVLGGRRARG